MLHCQLVFEALKAYAVFVVWSFSLVRLDSLISVDICFAVCRSTPVVFNFIVLFIAIRF